MHKEIYILGTDTDVGKTVISAGIMYLLLSKGYNACYFKPVSSGGTETGKGFLSYDASYVKGVSGLKASDDDINLFRFRTPVSPHLASAIEHRKIDAGTIADRYKSLKNRYDFIVVEGCGGLAVPLSDDGYMQYHLIKELGIECILISRTTPGTINHTLLTLSFAEKIGIRIRGIIFNGFDGSSFEEDNITTIKKLSGVPVIGVIPEIDGIDVERQLYGGLKFVFERAICIEELVNNVQL